MSTAGLHPRKQAWLVGLLQEGGGNGGGRLLLKIPGQIAQLHLDVTDDLLLSNGGEAVALSGGIYNR